MHIKTRVFGKIRPSESSYEKVYFFGKILEYSQICLKFAKYFNYFQGPIALPAFDSPSPPQIFSVNRVFWGALVRSVVSFGDVAAVFIKKMVRNSSSTVLNHENFTE